MNNRQIENSHLEAKIKLRQRYLGLKKNLTVLDAFSADGIIWTEISRRTQRKIIVVRLEKAKGKKGFYLQGDNKKFLSTIDIASFDIIDFDAFGNSFEQLEILWKKNWSDKTIFCTFIQTKYGILKQDMLTVLGYSRSMTSKCPTLFSRHGFEKFKQYLALRGIREINYSTPEKGKYYIEFKMNGGNNVHNEFRN